MKRVDEDTLQLIFGPRANDNPDNDRDDNDEEDNRRERG